jgi:hypothetical protein
LAVAVIVLAGVVGLAFFFFTAKRKGPALARTAPRTSASLAPLATVARPPPMSRPPVGHPTDEHLPGPEIDDSDLDLNRKDNSITGMVLESDGAPARGILVYASLEAFGVSRRATNPWALDGQATTSDDGSFQIDQLSSGSYQVGAQSISGEGHADHVRAGGDVLLRLRRTARVRGVVIRRAAGASREEATAVAHFTIHAYRVAPEAESLVDAVARLEGPASASQTVFDVHGRFEINGLRAGAYALVAGTPDDESGQTEVTLDAGEDRANVQIPLQRWGVLRGHVVDYDTNQPVVGCHVQALFADRELDALTRPDGAFQISGPSRGQTVHLRLSAADYIDDMHTTARRTANDEEDLGTIKLVRGRWTQSAELPGWVLEGEIEHTAVIAVAPASAAANSGILPGAVVVSVGGKDARNLGPLSIHFLASGRPGPFSPVDLRLPDGTVRRLELQRSRDIAVPYLR